MDEVTVKVIPVAPENMRFCGGTKYINIFNNEGINMNGDYIKVYKLQGKKWKCLAQIKKAKLSNGKVFTVKKLKPGKITEWREPYNVYCSSVKIKVSKVKGTSGYSFSNGRSIKKNSGNVKIGSAINSKSKLPKKVKIKVRTYRKINSYSIAYGKYSKAVSVRVR